MGGCVIHFGMHKTGSSSIQQSLYKAQDLGPDHCLIRLGKRTGNLSGELVTAFADEPWRANVHRKRGTAKEEVLKAGPEVRARVAAEVAAADRTAVLSGEAVCMFSEVEFSRLTRALADAAGPVAAVGYVRAPAERMASGFQQRLKGGFDRFDPAEFYPREGYRRLEAFDRVLGREQVSLWKFDPGGFPEGDVVRDFCTRLGIEIAAEDIVRVNEGLSRPAMSILFAYRAYGPGYGVGWQAVRENRALVEALQGVRGPRFGFHESVVAPVLDVNRDDLAWIEDRLGQELRSKSFGSEGVSSADELLEIEPSALDAFFDALQDRFGIELPGSASARADTDPHAVAMNVQACREAIREVIFGPPKPQAPHGAGGAPRRNGQRRLVARAAASRGRWREDGEDVIVLAPTPRQPAVVGLEAVPGMGETGKGEFSAQVRASDATPLVLRLSIAGGGEEGRLLDEISIAGRSAREWRVAVPISSADQFLRLSCSVKAGHSKDRRARVRVARASLEPATR